MNQDRQKIRLKREELEEIPLDQRIALFGHDPLDKKNEPTVSKWTIVLVLAITGLIVGSTAFFIEFVMRPGFNPNIDHSEFVIPASEEVLNSELFLNAEQLWISRNTESFLVTAERLLQNETLNKEGENEVRLYMVRALVSDEEFNRANAMARNFQSRYSNETQFIADLYYYRGHCIGKMDGLKAAYPAFSESYALGSRYAEESRKVMNQIERMNRPLW